MGRDAVYVLASAALVAFWCTAILFVLLGATRNHAVEYSQEARQRVLSVTPQGWAFFTKNPREPEDLWVTRSEHGWKRAMPLPADPANLFGLKKGMRAHQIERMGVLSGVGGDRWRMCPVGWTECLRHEPLEAVPVTNAFPLKQVCGELLVIRQPPVPWAWSKSMQKIEMPSQIVLLDIRCDADAEQPSTTQTTPSGGEV